MKEPDRHVVVGLTVLMLLLWLGFLVHRSARFAGSLWGGMFGVSGALLMLVPLLYLVVKRIRILKGVVTKRMSLRTLLAWHIYAGILGPILAIVHTGHKFVSPLGISLTGMMLFVSLSGFAGRYLMKQVSENIREKKETLTQLEIAYGQIAGRMTAHLEQTAFSPALEGLWPQLAAMSPLRVQQISKGASAVPVLRLVDSMADLEYALKTHETFKRLFAAWLKFHIITSFLLYGLLFLHICAEIHFGLRWFS